MGISQDGNFPRNPIVTAINGQKVQTNSPVT